MREAISWSVAPKNRLYIWESWQSFPNIRIRFLRQSELQSVLQLHPCWSRNFSVILSVYVRLQLSCVKPHSHLRIFYVRAYMKLWLQIKATSRHTIVVFKMASVNKHHLLALVLVILRSRRRRKNRKNENKRIWEKINKNWLELGAFSTKLLLVKEFDRVSFFE